MLITIHNEILIDLVGNLVGKGNTPKRLLVTKNGNGGVIEGSSEDMFRKEYPKSIRAVVPLNSCDLYDVLIKVAKEYVE